MKRLLRLTAACAAALVVVALLRHHSSPGTSPQVDAKAAVLQEPTEAARNYVTALLANDLATAVTWSTPLLVARLADSPAVLRGQPASRVSIDLLLLDSDDRSADVAVELHGSDGRIAALRVELVLTAQGWRVAGVQP